MTSPTKISLIAVGKPRGPLAGAIGEYEQRVQHYFRYRAAEVREEPARHGTHPDQVRGEEGKRLLARVPAGAELVALDRTGRGWSSVQLAAHLASAGAAGVATAFLIGGAYGLSEGVLARADRLLSLSTFTLPHELARLMLVEQIYRAGTIARNEPYHKGREER